MLINLKLDLGVWPSSINYPIKVFFKKVAFKIWIGIGGCCKMVIGGPQKGSSAG
mgnify:CR=1 FL=1